MIDLHCHMLPGIDDGAADLATALSMARIAADDGIRTLACTPHIYPGLFENDQDGIAKAVSELQRALDAANIDLRLTMGADTHLVPEVLDGLRGGRIPTLAGTRYFLLEPAHHVAPPQFAESVFVLQAAGYMPVITHPERLSWIEGHYAVFQALAKQGVWMQITAGSLSGRFGKVPRYWAERMLDEGIVHILATDAHDPKNRPPKLAEGQRCAEHWVGAEEARRLVVDRPAHILKDLEPGAIEPPPGLGGERVRSPRAVKAPQDDQRSWFSRLFG